MATTSPCKDRGTGAQTRIALFLSSLEGGGVERVMLNLADAFTVRGYRVDLVLCHLEGPYRKRLPAGVNTVTLRATSALWARLRILASHPADLKSLLRPVLLSRKVSKKFRYLPDLIGYLRRERPHILLSAETNVNLVALWARRLAQVSTRVVVSEHITHSPERKEGFNKRQWDWRLFPSLINRTYSWADAIIAVSRGVADDLFLTTGIPRECMTTIYNPVVTPELFRKAQLPVDHPWFQPSAPPIVLGVGRLHKQKDFPTLLRAFARVRAKQAAHLVILGEANAKEAQLSTELLALATQLGIADDIVLPGFVDNPFAYMARASVFVLSSAWEGFGNVIAEALACGCPVVSTDCPSGPAEILEDGKYGPLVPVGDDAALADAISSVLNVPPNRDALRARGALFTAEAAADRYLEVLLGKERAKGT